MAIHVCEVIYFVTLNYHGIKCNVFVLARCIVRISECVAVDYGSWFDYTLEWEKVIKDNPDYPFHIISYEEMKAVTVTISFTLYIP